MHDALRMCLGEPVSDLRRDVERFVNRERSRRQPLLQRLALVVGHDDEQLSVGGGRDVVNGADVRMVGCGGGLRFANETLPGVFVVTPLRWKKLQRDGRPSFVSRAWYTTPMPPPPKRATIT